MNPNQALVALRQLFKREKRQPPVEAPGASAPGEKGQQPGPGGLLIGLASDPGRVRDHNEDASLACQFMMAQQGRPPLPVGLFVMADGMGGHARGEQASAFAVRLVASHLIRHLCLPMLEEEEAAGPAPINDLLEDSIRLAHQAVSRRLPEAGTTLTLALVLGDGVHIAHVGDSRVYLGQRGSLRCLTRDHSVAARLVEMGQASPEEVALQRNILYKALGQGPQIEPDILYHDLENGQYLLLCCDGLWGKVSEARMVDIIDAAPTPDIACQDLVAEANRNGGEDNISVILAARGWPLPARQMPRVTGAHGP